jgi:transcriptional regulator with XRE-family HTH domain
MDKIYRTIKRLREEKNISREQMANLLNISLSGYAKIERGEVEISLTRFNKFSKILGYTPVEIIEMDNHYNASNSVLTPYQLSENRDIQKMEFPNKNDYIYLLEQRIYELKKRLENSNM